MHESLAELNEYLRELDYILKLSIIGDCGTGKSCLRQRMMGEGFQDHKESTVGVEFGTKRLVHDAQRLSVQLWDLSGRDASASLTESYYRGHVGFLVVYSVTDENSFLRLPHWLARIERLGLTDVPVVIVGNKIDSDIERQVECERGKEFASSKGALFFETSAKDNLNVDEAFKALLTISIKYHDSRWGTDRNANPPNIGFYNPVSHNGCCYLL